MSATEGDPMKQAWNEVADGFSTLGRLMKERYQDAGEEEPATGGDTPDAGAALRDAFDRLRIAARDLGDRAADVARDDDVKAQAKRAASSLNDALSATVNLIGDQVGGLFKRSRDDDATPAVPASQPAADDARQ
jgi:hypothetical protein